MADYVRLHGLGRPSCRRAGTSPSRAMPNWTRATSTRPCWKAGSTTSATSGGSSTTTARAWIPSCPTGCSAASRACSATWAGTCVTIKFGRALEAAFAREGGEELRRWIDDCPNSLYSALTFQGGAAWRQALLADLGRSRGVRAIIDPLSDDELAALMTNLGGHDIETLIEHFARPTRPATSRHASSPTPSRAWACPSPATRTTMPG